ncbi:hypothetical protein ULMS_17490 [Patiriisocius marinistellae]|uniref:Thioredoxin domain-containing protein n=1 Tax=Patiriisocius marinistellae TaxID=2494560 RepID=A0A5J4G280_9FLAO|nr:thioredoxin family protein [Patiriisocius marinistellae]GEQ86241.1 hypothetical protein ULMS_17490 [Patiriisocius marinistellae]
MKTILSILLLSITTYSFSQEVYFDDEVEETVIVEEQKSNLNWLTNIDEAIALSKKNSKPILIYFNGSDWCSPCVVLKEDFFETPEFEKRADKLILVMIDYPRRKDILSASQMKYNREMITKYNKSKTFPKLIMLNKNGNQVGKLSGYSSFNTYHDTSHHYKFVDKYISQ